MKKTPDGTYRFQSKWAHRGYWGITGALHLLLKAGGIFLLICLGILGTLGIIAVVIAIGGVLAPVLIAAAAIWAGGWLIGLVYGIVRASRSRTQTQEDDNVVPIEHAPRRRFRGR